MWTRSQEFDAAASWSPWALLALPGPFSGDNLLFSQKDQATHWASLCKPLPHLRTQPWVTSIYHQEIIDSGEPKIQWELFPIALLFCVLSACINFCLFACEAPALWASFFFYFVIFMAIINELRKISSNPVGFWLLSLFEVKFRSFFHRIILL